MANNELLEAAADEIIAKAARVAAVPDLGYGVCWDCEIAFEEHCDRCTAVYCYGCEEG
ncbi:hypothetical protein [Streptomyces filamentosus]|uniref:hypothetical protein n=1 Tax=Streptomyces filamentosus TaxID=67294 RepID=UPI0033ED4AD1